MAEAAPILLHDPATSSDGDSDRFKMGKLENRRAKRAAALPRRHLPKS
ncbi:MAG: hypothetical protein ACYC2H_10590 [Thermoplasmatota archaeon]